VRKSIGFLRRNQSVPVPVLASAARSVYAARLSPDGRRIAFTAGPSGADAQAYIAPYAEALIPENRWTPVPEAEGGQPAWSHDGRILYAKSFRDGSECIWGFPQGGGDPFPVVHFHDAAFGPGKLHTSEFQMSTARGLLVLNAARDRANVLFTSIRKE
jgi:hypothetical protein